MRGVQPQARTFHTSSAAIGARLFVFGGGDKGAEPVKDQRLHVFDTGNPAAVGWELCPWALVRGVKCRALLGDESHSWVAVLLLTGPYVQVVTGNSDPVA